jgi:four helix bundle protein
MQDFRRLRVWRKANALAIAVKRLTQSFPKTGYGSLRNQMTRSSESIPDNIADGCGTATSPDFAKFLDSSIKSTSELESQLERTHAYGLMDVKRYDWFTTQAQDVRKMTWSLRKKAIGSPPNEVAEEDTTRSRSKKKPRKRG